MNEGLQSLNHLHINPIKKQLFITTLEEQFNNCLVILQKAATVESLRHCLLAMGLEMVKSANDIKKAEPGQVFALKNGRR